MGTTNNNLILSNSTQDAVVDSDMVDVELVGVNDFTPDNEKAVEAVEAEKALYLAALEQGHFSPVIGMALIKGVCDDKLYAGLEIDEHGCRIVQLIQKLSNGSYTPKFSIRQSDLVILMRHGNDLSNATKTIKTLLTNFLKEFTTTYYNSTNITDIYDVSDIFKAVVWALPKLPLMVTNATSNDPREFYIKLIDVLYDTSPFVVKDSPKSYFILDESEMDELARALDMTKQRLLCYLREYGFLYLTESSLKYKVRVRDKLGCLRWAYCIKRLSYLDNSDADLESRERVKLEDDTEIEY